MHSNPKSRILHGGVEHVDVFRGFVHLLRLTETNLQSPRLIISAVGTRHQLAVSALQNNMAKKANKVRRVDRRTNALQTDQPTNGHSQLQRCFVAPKNGQKLAAQGEFDFGKVRCPQKFRKKIAICSILSIIPGQHSFHLSCHIQMASNHFTFIQSLPF